MVSKINIGCIGPSDSIAVIRKVVAQYYPGVVLKTYVEERILDAWKRIAQCQKETSGILFTGIGVQEAALASGGVTLPYEHVPRGGYSLIRALLEISRCPDAVETITVDVVEEDIIRSTTHEMNINFKTIHTFPFDPNQPEKAYEEYHIRLHKTGKADALVTGFGAVYENLRKAGYPVFRLYPSRFEIRENMDRLLSRITAKSLRSAGIAIQLIHLASIRKDSIHQYEDLKREGQFYLELLEYVQSLQGSLFRMGSEYVIYATRGSVEDREHTAEFCRLMDWGRKENIRIASGIGIGITAFEAEKSARKALMNALQAGENAFFIVHGDTITGPLGSDRELSYPFRISGGKDLRKAEEIGINPGYLAKIQSLVAKTGKTVFDARDLAACLGISDRSARRILKKFTNAGYGRVSGREAVGGAGRPKLLIELMV